MTVQELMNDLQDMNPEAEVRLAQHPAWSFEYAIRGLYETDGKEGVPVVYIGEGRQIGYLPEEVKEEFNW